MEVILLEKVGKLGNVGDLVNVKNGYGRNYLIPTKKALLATESNKQVFAAKKAEIEAENQAKKAESEKISTDIKDIFVVVIRQAGEDGRLYGSVTARDIIDAVNAKSGKNLNHKVIDLNMAIKSLGVYQVKLSLHPEVNVSVNLNVARSETEALEAEKQQNKDVAA